MSTFQHDKLLTNTFKTTRKLYKVTCTTCIIELQEHHEHMQKQTGRNWEIKNSNLLKTVQFIKLPLDLFNLFRSHEMVVGTGFYDDLVARVGLHFLLECARDPEPDRRPDGVRNTLPNHWSQFIRTWQPGLDLSRQQASSQSVIIFNAKYFTVKDAICFTFQKIDMDATNT